jgi:hypothetical protein
MTKEKVWQPQKPRIKFRDDYFRGRGWECLSPMGAFGGYRTGWGSTPAEAYERWKNWRPSALESALDIVGYRRPM